MTKELRALVGAASRCKLQASKEGLLGGSWVVISGVISPLIRVISIVTRVITLLIITHEPPSMGVDAQGKV